MTVNNLKTVDYYHRNCGNAYENAIMSLSKSTGVIGFGGRLYGWVTFAVASSKPSHCGTMVATPFFHEYRDDSDVS